MTPQGVLDGSPNVVQVIPLTSNVRGFSSEVRIAADEYSELTVDSSAQCQRIRSVSVGRVESVRGKVGSATIAEMRRVMALLMDSS